MEKPKEKERSVILIPITVTVPSNLLREFEEEIKGAGYGDRSEAIRDGMRTLIAKIRTRRR